MLHKAINKFNESLPAFKVYYAQAKDWDWKVIGVCFFTSFTFWLFNALSDEHNYDLRIPINFDYNKNKVLVLKEPPEDILVNVSGNGWNLFKSSVGSGIKAEIIFFDNLNATVSNDFILTRSLLPKISSKLKELQVNYILQDSIFFDFDTLTTREIVVLADEQSISLENGFRIIDKIVTSPSKIVVEGASSVLFNIDDTVFLSVEGNAIDADYDNNLSLDFLSSDYISPLTEEVNVQFSVAEFEKRTINVGLDLINFPEGTDVTVEPGTAEISYFIEKDEQYMPRDILKVVIDYTAINEYDSTILPILIVPPYFADYSYSPENFKVTIGE